MERDSAVSHGTPYFLQERLCTVADAYEAVFCRTCGTFALNDTTTEQYACRACGVKGRFGRVVIPYAWKLLSQLLAATGIFLRYDLKTEEELAKMKEEASLKVQQEEEEEINEEEEEEEEDVVYGEEGEAD